MSGVLVKAAACNKNILACQEGLIGHLTENYQLSVITNTISPEQIVNALDHLLKNSTSFDEFKRKEFAQQHELDKFTYNLMKPWNCDFMSKQELR